MELDEMKELWQAQHSDSAARHKAVRYPAIQTKKGQKGLCATYPGEQNAEWAAYDTSGGYLAALLKNEYIGLSIVILVLIVLLSMTARALGSVTALAGYVILLFSLAVQISVTVYKIMLLKQIDLAVNAVADVALRIDYFHLLIIRERLIGLSFIPIGMVSLYLFIDGYQVSQLTDILPKLLVSIVGAVILSYFMFKKMYFKKIKAIKEHIKTVRDFQDPADK